MEDEDVDATPEVTGHHITKRYRKNKFAVAVFDEKARQYVFSFRFIFVGWLFMSE